MIVFGVLADEGAGEIAGSLVGVHDAGSDSEEVLQASSGFPQLLGALLDPLLQFVIRLLNRFLGALAFAEIGGETDRSDLAAVVVEQQRRRDKHGNRGLVLGPQHAVKP